MDRADSFLVGDLVRVDSHGRIYYGFVEELRPRNDGALVRVPAMDRVGGFGFGEMTLVEVSEGFVGWIPGPEPRGLRGMSAKTVPAEVFLVSSPSLPREKIYVARAYVDQPIELESRQRSGTLMMSLETFEILGELAIFGQRLRRSPRENWSDDHPV